MLQKLKLFILDDTVYIGLLIILVSVCSFSLGRLSVTTLLSTNNSAHKEPFSLKSTNFDGKIATTTNFVSSSASTSLSSNNLLPALPNPEFSAINTKTLQPTVKYVASKSGTKYHLLTCPGAKNIKDSNKIYFTTSQEAESAGYEKATNCPGL